MPNTPGQVARVKMHDSGPELSHLNWGSMRSEGQFADAGELAQFLGFLLDRGITTLDAANIYGEPHAYTVEEFLGRAMAEVGPDEFEIVTKCGVERVSPHRPQNLIRHFDSSAEGIARSVDRSLANLGVETIDLLLVHWPDYLMDPDETGAALDGLIAAGKVRHIGLSNFSPSRLELLASRLKAPIVTNQVQFSPLHLAPISDGTFDQAIMRGFRPTIWSPLARGRLMTGDDEPAVKVRAHLADTAAKMGLAGPAEAAIAFIVRHPVGGVPILGTGKRERVDSAIAALNADMDRQDWYAIATQISPMLDL